jgi:hypothetical protein
MSTNADRFRILDSLRTSKLERSRFCSSLTIPSVLPPEGWNEQSQLPQPYSSISARGVTSMASRMLSALLPLNDAPFFRFELSSGIQPEIEIDSYLSNLSYQVYNKISSGNLRESIYQILQHLIVVGDVMVILEDDMNIRLIRIDRFVVRRNVNGDINEIIYKEYETIEGDQDDQDILFSSSLDSDNRPGYKSLYTRLTKSKEENIWKSVTECVEGIVQNSGEFTVPNFIVLRWAGIAGENYGRSHCEDMIGDIKALEGFTEGLINGITASSIFWMAVDPTGMAEVDDINGTPTGGWISARPNEVHVVSPATTMNPQINHTQNGVNLLRQEIGRAFLLDSASIPQGERVTATAVRMIGQELEHVLGGAFSAIARDLMRPLVARVVFLMTTNGEVDERLEEMFSKEGLLNVDIITGLQALSRDSDLQKLMQMGEMIRNLPEAAAMMFRWDQYGKALITSLGFNSELWIKSEEQVREEQMKLAQAQGQVQSAQQNELMMNQAITGAVAQAAQQDISETGGAGIQQAMQQMQGVQ